MFAGVKPSPALFPSQITSARALSSSSWPYFSSTPRELHESSSSFLKFDHRNSPRLSAKLLQTVRCPSLPDSKFSPPPFAVLSKDMAELVSVVLQ
ncbi:hypothetical protein EJB05_08407, partial [Eragrostis curvula]